MAIFTTNGKLLTVGTAGLAIASDCCCTTTNPCPNEKPPLKVTVSWTGSPPELVGGNYVWLGQSFSNGESKLICPTDFNCSNATGTAAIQRSPAAGYNTFGGGCSFGVYIYSSDYANTWINNSTNGIVLDARWSYKKNIYYYGTGNSVTCNITSTNTVAGPSAVYQRRALVYPLGGKYLVRERYRVTSPTISSQTFTISSGISTDNINPATFVVNTRPMKINDQQMGSLATTSGVTITWERAVTSAWDDSCPFPPTTTCTGTTNACMSNYGTTLQSTPIPCPQMVLQIFDADYSGGSIKWCGKTWTQSEIQAGVEKAICPTSYDRGYYYPTSIEVDYRSSWSERWNNAPSGGELGLVINMIYARTPVTFPPTVYNRLKRVWLWNFDGNGGPISDWLWDDKETRTGSTPSSTFSLSLINGVAMPETTDYTFRNKPAFFGTYTRPDGVQFGWRKGVNW